MPFKAATPAEAAKTLAAKPDAVYLDVRSQREFVAGHPAGAINVPVAEPDPRTGQMAFNPEFVAVVEKTLARDRTIVVGCMSGKRSEMACRTLEQSGYLDLTNVIGGFGGLRDPVGTLLQPGWVDSGLPVASGPGDEASYESLRRKAFGA
jgi:rhodanese-related sulfurtransferase